jgi:hypothetical protein
MHGMVGKKPFFGKQNAKETKLTHYDINPVANGKQSV